MSFEGIGTVGFMNALLMAKTTEELTVLWFKLKEAKF